MSVFHQTTGFLSRLEEEGRQKKASLESIISSRVSAEEAVQKKKAAPARSAGGDAGC